MIFPDSRRRKIRTCSAMEGIGSRIEIDAVPNEEVSRAESGYVAIQLSAIIDNTPPQLSATIPQRDLSPNGDTIVDEAQINYGLSEDLAELELQFTDPSYRPAVPLMQLTEGNHSFTWAGVDGLRHGTE